MYDRPFEDTINGQKLKFSYDDYNPLLLPQKN